MVRTGRGQNRLLWNRGRRAFLPALVAFAATGLAAPLYSSDGFDWELLWWQSLVLWPIGLLVLAAPGWLLTQYILHPVLFRVGQVILVVAGVWAMAATAVIGDAQAGLNLLIAPMYGTPAMVALLVGQWTLRRRRSDSPR